MKLRREPRDTILVTISKQDRDDDPCLRAPKERALKYWDRNYRTFDCPYNVTVEIKASERDGGELIEVMSIDDVIRRLKPAPKNWGNLTNPIQDENVI